MPGKVLLAIDYNKRQHEINKLKKKSIINCFNWTLNYGLIGLVLLTLFIK